MAANSSSLQIIDANFAVQSAIISAACGAGNEARLLKRIIDFMPRKDKEIAPDHTLQQLISLRKKEEYIVANTVAQQKFHFIVRVISDSVDLKLPNLNALAQDVCDEPAPPTITGNAKASIANARPMTRYNLENTREQYYKVRRRYH